MRLLKKSVRGALCAVFWVAAWAAFAYCLGKPLLLPGPLDTLRALFRLSLQGAFWQSAGLTLARVLAGYLGAVALGVLLAGLCHFLPFADALLSPLRSVVRATPVSSFIILVLLWLDIGVMPAFISFLMVLPIVWLGVQEGLGATDPLLLEMTRAYRLTPWQRARHLYLPSLRPHFTAACATGLGFAWKSGIAAEVIAKPLFSIGKNIADAKVYLETSELFAWTLVVILLSMALERALMRVVRGGKGGAKA